MNKVYFASDPHLGHYNLCKYVRQMDSIESDKLIIDNWNKLITKRDKVYLCGDVTMEDPERIIEYIKRLNGNIVVIGGNHDTEECAKKLAKANIPIIGALQYKGYICTHIPVSFTEFKYFKGNIHGHLHKKSIFKDGVLYDPEQPLGPYFNVNLEFNDYKPVLFEDINNYIDSKKYNTLENKLITNFMESCPHHIDDYECDISDQMQLCITHCKYVEYFKNNLNLYDNK